MCLAQACFDRTPKSYRAHLDDTLKEDLPDWANRLLDRLK
jgi:hypothetical protein